MLEKRRFTFPVLLFAWMLFVTVFSDATPGDAGYELIDIPRLEQLLDSEPKTVLAFAASPLEFSMERIPNSICVPTELVEIYYNLPADLDTPLVFYCLSISSFPRTKSWSSWIFRVCSLAMPQSTFCRKDSTETKFSGWTEA